MCILDVFFPLVWKRHVIEAKYTKIDQCMKNTVVSDLFMSSLYYEKYGHFQSLNFLFNPKWTFIETKQQKQLKTDIQL